MVDKKKIIDNYEPSENIGNFFILDDTEESWLYGEIELDEALDQFISLIKEEIDYSWGPEFSDMNEYLIFYIDTNDKNNLKEIKNNGIYQKVKKLEEIYIAIIHKKIPYRIIENIPPLFEWFMDFSLN
ncbi:MAG: hypothetical protein ACFFBP_17940 [Promethearchaeota archaeon]